MLSNLKIIKDRRYIENLQSAEYQTGSISENSLFLCYLDYFKNHKNQRSQIAGLNFILKILQSAKSQTGSIFFSPQNSSVI